ncbi:MAG: helix-turn-helix domain-containing protein [Clostridiales bacterium]|nr:helix-turn-helix domain-containing protein [Clostridiales bacterium]
MSETRYMISDASKKVNVEAHVLRYWEDELELVIPRNEMGHRYYTEAHIRTFKQIKELKENGYQLKAIKMILPKLAHVDEEEFHLLTALSEEMNRRACEDDLTAHLPAQENQDKNTPANVIPISRSTIAASPDERYAQFQQLMNDIISNALVSNTQLLGDCLGNYIGQAVSDRLVEEIAYQFQNREEIQEARFKQLDEAIRMRQKSNLEAAAAKAPKEKKKHLFFRKEKELLE